MTLELAEHEQGNGWRAPTTSESRPPRRGSIALSAALHAAVLAALIVGLPGLQESPSAPLLVPVDLVQLGDTTAASSAEQAAPLPQQRAEEATTVPEAAAIPEPQAPPPSAPQTAAERSPPPVVAAAKPQAAPALAKPAMNSREDARAAAKLHPPTPPVDTLVTRLEKLAQLRQPPAQLPPSPRQQQGAGESNVDAASADAARGRDASYGIKDYIRAQVERRWNLDRRAVQGRDWSVAIRMTLDERGKVDRAVIVDDPRYDDDPGYRDFALSARNAVLLSSPLLLPPGSDLAATDVVVDFSARDLSR